MRKILSVIFLFLSLFAYSQEIAVSETEFLENDLAARTNPRLDANGNPCALIRVVLPSVQGMQFEGWVVGKAGYKPGEYQVYVPAGTKKISFRHADYLPGEIVFTVPIEGKCVYRVKLTAPELPKQGTKKLQTSQYLVFNVTPADAIVEVEGEIWNNNGGSARKFVPFGDYTYSVQAKDYHSSSGKVSVSDPTNKVVVDVKLLPAFGWVEIKANESNRGGTVFIDNKQIGTVPCKSGQLASGTHTVRIVKSLYGNWQQQITIEDNKTAELSPELSANFANVKLTVDNNAEIWVNGEMKGKGSWSGNLSTGEYEFETKAENHRPSHVNKSLSVSKEQVVISLPAPTPIFGSLEVSTLPAMAEVFVDGEKRGETPLTLSNVLIGTHTVTVHKSGYGDLTRRVELTEGQTVEVSGSLAQSTTVTFECNNPNATIFIDGESKGKIASTYDLGYGEHAIRITANGYKDLEKTINVTADKTNTFNFLQKLEDVFSVNGVTFKMIEVEGGYLKEDIAVKSFCIGQTEVTQALWKAVMDTNPSKFTGDNLPVHSVSWNDCIKFIYMLNRITGRKFRFPTETEWEYAARGGKKTHGYKCSGSNYPDSVCWVSWNSSHKPQPVATKYPNELGIYDMSGNVWEWCLNWYDKGYNIDFQISKYIASRRGGAYNNTGPVALDEGQPFGSSGCDVDIKVPDLGLRLAMSMPEDPLEDCTYLVKDTYFTNNVYFKMKPVEGGEFLMGAMPEQKEKKKKNEDTIRSVQLVKVNDFFVGETEVTQELWDAVMGSKRDSSLNQGVYYLPVESISWNDCREFITKLNKITGASFRLLTEEEWEFAARGGNKTQGYMHSGSNSVDEVAWFYSNSGVMKRYHSNRAGGGYVNVMEDRETHRVASKKANELGIYDMSGNVWEMCENGACRGGAYDSNLYDCFVVSSKKDIPKGGTLGFRLALSKKAY
ncbi:MAG: SUMF1/EgtB/PvdO family nonheme iron enzyme [Bacteroidaceae bacterium]|nr:SUMF1/EgtB/PvdO family nonheme iron enzyme [Bacteroidaceae bacterium]